jgi:hypothetical protein
MAKTCISVTFIILFFVTISSCSTSKNSIQIKLNDIDSAIRIVIPSHNCGCNWQERKSNISIPTIFTKYNYVWQAIFIKSLDSVDVNNDSKKVLQQLIKLDKRFADVKRLFLEYRIPVENDTLNYKAVGTWYHFEGYCDGYISKISAKELEKNTTQTKDRKKLCK